MPRAISRASDDRQRAASANTDSRVSPSTNSMAMNGSPRGVPASKIRMMLGWWIVGAEGALAKKPLGEFTVIQEMVVGNLQRHHPAVSAVFGAVSGRHSSSAEPIEKSVVTDQLRFGPGGGRGGEGLGLTGPRLDPMGRGRSKLGAESDGGSARRRRRSTMMITTTATNTKMPESSATSFSGRNLLHRRRLFAICHPNGLGHNVSRRFDGVGGDVRFFGRDVGGIRWHRWSRRFGSDDPGRRRQAGSGDRRSGRRLSQPGGQFIQGRNRADPRGSSSVEKGDGLVGPAKLEGRPGKVEVRVVDIEHISAESGDVSARLRTQFDGGFKGMEGPGPPARAFMSESELIGIVESLLSRQGQAEARQKPQTDHKRCRIPAADGCSAPSNNSTPKGSFPLTKHRERSDRQRPGAGRKPRHHTQSNGGPERHDHGRRVPRPRDLEPETHHRPGHDPGADGTEHAGNKTDERILDGKDHDHLSPGHPERLEERDLPASPNGSRTHRTGEDRDPGEHAEGTEKADAVAELFEDPDHLFENLAQPQQR